MNARWGPSAQGNLYRLEDCGHNAQKDGPTTKPCCGFKHVPVLSECPNCDGKGFYVVQSTRGPMETDDIECPDCGGRGVRIPDEWVEAGAKARCSHWYNGVCTDHDQHIEEARAVIAAVLDCIEREET